MNLHLPRAAEAALSAVGVAYAFRFFEVGDKAGRNHKLRYAFLILYGLRIVRVIVQRHDDLASVIAVDNPHFVCRRKRAFACKSASGIYESDKTVGNLDCNACVYKHGLMRLDCDGFSLASVQVRSCGKLRAVFGYYCVFIQFFDFYGYVLHIASGCAKQYLSLRNDIALWR